MHQRGQTTSFQVRLEIMEQASAGYQLSLRRAFLTSGLPETLTLDHSTVFYDNTTPCRPSF